MKSIKLVPGIAQGILQNQQQNTPNSCSSLRRKCIHQTCSWVERSVGSVFWEVLLLIIVVILREVKLERDRYFLYAAEVKVRLRESASA